MYPDGMPPFHPTPRELVLLTVLLVSLLFLSARFPSNPSSVSDLLRSSPHVVEDELDVLPLALETQYTLQALNPPLSWEAGAVPETKIVAHVPGKSLLPCICRSAGRTSRMGTHLGETPHLRPPCSSASFLLLITRGHNGAERELAPIALSHASEHSSQSLQRVPGAMTINYQTVVHAFVVMRPSGQTRL